MRTPHIEIDPMFWSDEELERGVQSSLAYAAQQKKLAADLAQRLRRARSEAEEAVCAYECIHAEIQRRETGING